MGDVQPGDRPVFDYPGSLELATEMYRMAASLEAAGATRHKEWNEALDVWKGNVGDHFGNLIADDESDLTNTASVLREEAGQWARLWANTVDEANRVLAAEARELLRAHRNKDDEGLQWHDIDDIWDKDEKKRKESFDIPAAPPVETPAPPAFQPPRNPFALYVLSGDDMIISGFSIQIPPYVV